MRHPYFCSLSPPPPSSSAEWESFAAQRAPIPQHKRNLWHVRFEVQRHLNAQLASAPSRRHRDKTKEWRSVKLSLSQGTPLPSSHLRSGCTLACPAFFCLSFLRCLFLFDSLLVFSPFFRGLACVLQRCLHNPRKLTPTVPFVSQCDCFPELIYHGLSPRYRNWKSSS